MKTTALLFSLALFLQASAFAELAASHAAAVEKLLIASQMDQQIKASFMSGLDVAFGANSDQVAAMPKDQQEKLKAALEKAKAKMSELVTWEKFKPRLMEMYAKHFTEKEALEVTAMLETPAGRLFASKQTAMVVDLASFSGQEMKSIMPAIMQVIQSEMQK